MRNTLFRTVGALLSVAAVVAVAGCGSSKSSAPAAPSPTVTVTTTTPATPTTPSSTPGTTTTTTPPTTTTPATPTTASGGTPTPAVAAKCLDFAGASAKASQAFSSALSGGGVPDTEKVKAYYAALADKAPSSIKASFVTLTNVIVTYLDEIKGLNIKPGQTPSADALLKLQKASATIRSSGFQQAAAKIGAWVKGGCR
jgi:hypothetical protein